MFRMQGWCAAVLLAVSWLSVMGIAHSAERTNVLFLIADDLNCDLSCYGHPLVKSPNIDRLAARGVRFERAYCQFPLCGPSRASFMTGLYPDQTLILANAIRVRERIPNVVTMPQTFRENGYTPVRVGKLYHYGVPGEIGTDGHDDPPSWDKVFNPRGRDKDEESQVFTLRKGNYGGTLSWMASDGTDAEQTDGIGATEATKLLDEFAANKKPFFLAVGFYRPHTPYVSPKKYFDMYSRDAIEVPKVPDGYLDTIPKPAAATVTAKQANQELSDDLKREAMQAYYASITFMDAQVGRVLDALEKTGLAKNTVVVMTSDHGYHMGQHGHFQKMTLFENAARVPLIIAAPEMKTAGQSTKALAESVDFFPTLSEVCGIELRKNISGMSLASVLKDPAAHPRDSALTRHRDGYTLRTDRYRYTEWGPEGKDGNELYDHESDPAEMTNLASKPEQKQRIAELSKQLHDRIAQASRVPEGLEQLKVDDSPQRGGQRRRLKAKGGA